jgi:hypothetical protein
MSKAEEQFLFASGVAIGTAKHLGEDEHKQRGRGHIGHRG